ncbi:MAG: phosphate ABC transporter, permease protein PstA, partial [Lewinellaceae bacterium]|nr:phosphate ABC transporter, permease protein PstA [Lewinellaceae bacterium]
MNRRIIQFLGLALMITATLIVVAILGLVLFDLTAKGAPSISWEFLTQ